MYNRYIPQPDGSFRRSRMPEQYRPLQQKPSPPPPPSIPEAPPPSPHPPRKCQDTSVSGFLHRILPKDFDTGDLLIIVLLLLIAGDCIEDQNTALLTIALYFFM